MVNVLITGGSGALGTALHKKIPKEWNVYAPGSDVCDITDYNCVHTIVQEFKPSIVIHAAAFVDTFGCEQDKAYAIQVNVIGTANLVRASVGLDCKFVYISSEYVFGGERGFYTVDDRLNPKNVYGKTKAASEYIVSTLPNYQIIRAPFVRKIYTKAFADQYSSKYFLEEAATRIIKNIQYSSTPILHIASERLSLYDLYKSHGYEVEPMQRDADQLRALPTDTSLISNEHE
jgi:dTDP-4-dehydrorhamnose reductase